MVKINEVKRTYYLNLFSDNAQINNSDGRGSIVTGFTVDAAGSGYTEAPNVKIIGTGVGSIGSDFAAIGLLTATTVKSDGYTIVNGGSGYVAGDVIVFDNTGTGGSGVVATIVATAGIITGITQTNAGSGYNVKAPLIASITSTAGTGGQIKATLNSSSVASVRIDNGGSGDVYYPLSAVFVPTNGLGSGATLNMPTFRAIKNYIYKWNIRDLMLGKNADIALVQIAHRIDTYTITNLTQPTNATMNNTPYAIRCQETYADGFDSYNNTSAILYLGMGLNAPQIATYHKLTSQNLNTITLIITDDLSSSSKIYGGIDPRIHFSVILEVIDYIDDMNTY
jgi:hypothetical protein